MGTVTQGIPGRVLLDTHALLWWVLDAPRITPRADAVVRDGRTTVFVSAASAWEVATKVRLGKLPWAAGLSADFAAQLARERFAELPVTVAHGQRAGALPGSHKDPFDRMLIAQAQAENLAVVSNETLFDAFGITRIW